MAGLWAKIACKCTVVLMAIALLLFSNTAQANEVSTKGGHASVISSQRSVLQQRAKKIKSCALTKGGWCEAFYRQPLQLSRLAPRGNKNCPKDCLLGVCDADTGLCRCPAGAGGVDCGEPDLRPCTDRFRETGHQPTSHIDDDGRDLNLTSPGGTYSRCHGICEPNTGLCYCDDPKYGRINAPKGSTPGSPPVRVGRPMHEFCQANADEHGNKVEFGNVPREHIYSAEGWCRADTPPHSCGCSYEGYQGATCDIVTEHFCYNQCGGHGNCVLGFCKCHAGWYGMDCTLKREGLHMEPAESEDGSASPREWLRELVVTPPAAKVAQTRETRKRPFIYVYNLPSKYNSRMLAYRGASSAGTWRRFSEGNYSAPFQDVYIIEPMLTEMMLQSEHRTFDPEEADFFYVPLAISPFPHPIHSFSDHPWWYAPLGPRISHIAFMMKEVKDWLDDTFPWWKRRGGRDHIWLMSHDEGACYAPTEIFNTSIMLTHWGRMELNHTSNTAYGPDNYSAEFSHPELQPNGWQYLIQGHPCYDPKKDLVIPAGKLPHVLQTSPLLGVPARVRSTLLFFRGDVGKLREPHYSRGIRQRLYNLTVTHDWREKHSILIGDRQDIEGDYSEHLATSNFCLAAPGDGWSGRVEDAVLHGCVPLLIADNVHFPLESVVALRQISVRVKESQLEQVPDILKAISNKQLRKMQKNLAKVWHRFMYVRHPLLQQQLQASYAAHAEQRRSAVAEAGGPGEGDKDPDSTKATLQPAALDTFPTDDDAFGTIIQWLFGKLRDKKAGKLAHRTQGSDVTGRQADKEAGGGPGSMVGSGLESDKQPGTRGSGRDGAGKANARSEKRKRKRQWPQESGEGGL